MDEFLLESSKLLQGVLNEMDKKHLSDSERMHYVDEIEKLLEVSEKHYLKTLEKEEQLSYQLREAEKLLIKEQENFLKAQQKQMQMEESLKEINNFLLEMTVLEDDLRIQIRHQQEALESRSHEKEKLEQLLNSLQDDLNMHDYYLKTIQQAAMSEMVFMLAHQWKQPLTVIMMSLSGVERNIINKSSMDEESKALLTRMNSMALEQTRYLDEIIKDFLELQKEDEDRQCLPVRDVIERALKMCSARGELIAPQVDIQVNNEVDELPILTNKLTQAFVNIINNSYDEFEQKKVLQPRLSFHLKQAEGYQTIEITDNAGGAPEHLLEELFNPYQSSKGLNGTGLGLYLVQVVVKEHHYGEVSACNVDNGLKIELKIPCGA